MSQIKIQLFASLREQFGTESVELDWPKANSVNELILALESALGPDASGALQAPEILVAINQTLVERDHQVEAGDEVALLPPVTGG